MIQDDWRYVCNDDRCLWVHPISAKEIYTDYVDCTDMDDNEFLEFITKKENKEK